MSFPLQKFSFGNAVGVFYYYKFDVLVIKLHTCPPMLGIIEVPTNDTNIRGPPSLLPLFCLSRWRLVNNEQITSKCIKLHMFHIVTCSYEDNSIVAD